MYRIIKWGDKEYMLSWNKKQNLYYCADLPSLTFYSNYNDLEAAVFYDFISYGIRYDPEVRSYDFLRHIKKDLGSQSVEPAGLHHRF